MMGSGLENHQAFICSLVALRTQTELALRDDFDQRAFHDFVLAQGLLPPEILKTAVMQEFVPSQRRE